MVHKEKCGIVGVCLEKGNAAFSIFYSLYALQHRGQEAAGIAVSASTREDEGEDEDESKEERVSFSDIYLYKNLGLVYEAFNDDRLELLKGNTGIGHVRYSTAGTSRVENAQPLLVNYKWGKIAIAHNGNLVNAEELRNKLIKEGRIFHSDSDTEVIAHLLVKELMKHDIIEGFKELTKQLVGSYSLVILIDNTLIAVRDPLGFKPLCIGELKGEGEGEENKGYIIASESVAIDTLGGKLIRDVKPGEVLVVNNGELESYQLYRSKRTAHCVFEYIYFARPDSMLDGKLVYDVRMKIGEKLAEEHPVEADIVTPVPDSGVTFAIGYAKSSKIDYMESFIKNRYIGRTFIMPGQISRETAVRLKLNVVRSNVRGKRIILVDDSIVRGTTSKRIVDYLRSEGAKEVHMRVGSPPIKAPCYLGIDMPTREELMASKKSIEEICEMLHANSIGYLSIEGLINSIGIARSNLCLGCLTGKYPIEIPEEECIVRQMKLAQF